MVVKVYFYALSHLFRNIHLFYQKATERQYVHYLSDPVQFSKLGLCYYRNIFTRIPTVDRGMNG